MSTHLKVYGATRSGDPLCKTCTKSHIIKGAGFSQEVTFCNASYDHSMVIKYPVVECNRYHEANRPSLDDMAKIATLISADRRTGKIGFSQGSKLSASERETLVEELHDNNPLN